MGEGVTEVEPGDFVVLCTKVDSSARPAAASLHVLPLDRPGGIETVLDEHDKAAVNLDTAATSVANGQRGR
jgi:hypothetical protein